MCYTLCMSLNCNEIDAVLAELDLTQAFVQDVVQPSYDSIALYTYKPGSPKTVFICLAANVCRLHETRRKIPKNAKPLRFNELLKAKLKGARITSCTQLGKERIIVITLHKDAPIIVMPAAQEKLAKAHAAKAEADADGENFTLYIRLWSNAANIFLCTQSEAGAPIIIDSFYRRPNKGEVSGAPLVLPEPRPVSKEWPIRSFTEIQAQASAAEPTAEPLTFNQKVDLFYSQSAQTASLAALHEQSERWYNEHKSRQQAALERLRAKQNDFLHAEQWKHYGDLLLAYAYLRNDNADFLECEDYDGGSLIRIPLDPKKTTQENAASYYETYKKQSGALEALEHDISRAEQALAALDAQYARMKAEQNPLKLEQLLRKHSTPKQQLEKPQPGLAYTISGWTLLVGRDATENDELLRHHVRGMDLWLHTRDYAGGYVFIKNRPGKTVPLEILLAAGNLAVYFSKARKNGSADLYYTQVKHLRRAKNAPKGTVLPTNEKNLFIKLDEAKIRKMQENNMNSRT